MSQPIRAQLVPERYIIIKIIIIIKQTRTALSLPWQFPEIHDLVKKMLKRFKNAKT